MENEEMWKVTKIIYVMLRRYSTCALLYHVCLVCTTTTCGARTKIPRSDAPSLLPLEKTSVK